MTSKIKYDAEVYNRFYDTDTYFPWTPVSGTWDLVDGGIGYEESSGAQRVYAGHTAGDQEAWFSFKRVGYLNGMFDGFRVRLRNIDANNYLDVWWGLGLTMVEECVNGTPTILTTLQNVGEEEGVWYDVYVQLEDDSVVMYVGIRGEEMVKVVDETTDVAASTNSIQIIVSSGLSEFRFDDIKVMTQELSDKTIAMTYGAGNQLTNMVRGDGVEVDFAYNAWGRVSHIDMVAGQDSFNMDFVYECGNMLKRVETDVPGMPAEVEYFTDGLGKRRYKLVPDETLTCYRWDAGHNVLTEYIDDTGQWNAPDFTRFFVPKGHTAFAEGVPDANGNPIYGTYNYLAHDHLGTGRFAYDQAKSQIGMVEHDPYGERTNQTGYVPYHEFTGKPFDEETGMYYFPYRYYHPHLARWTTPDPAGLVDGPNVYGYVRGNSINAIDPLGKWCIRLPSTRWQEDYRTERPTKEETLLCHGFSHVNRALAEFKTWRVYDVYSYRNKRYLCCRKSPCQLVKCFIAYGEEERKHEEARIEDERATEVVYIGSTTTWIDVISPLTNRRLRCPVGPPN